MAQQHLEEQLAELRAENEKLFAELNQYKQARQSQTMEETRYRLLVENMNDGIVAIDANLNINYVNQRFAELLGYEVKELLGLAFKALLNPANQAIFDEQVALRRKGLQSIYQLDWIRKDGTLIPTLVSGSPLSQVPPEFVGSFAVVTDMTERKRAEEEHQAHLHFFSSMDQVNRAIQSTNELQAMMIAVLDAILSIFACDRAALQYPCEPDAGTWQLAMERCRPEYPGVLPIGTTMPLDTSRAEIYRLLKNAAQPVQFGPELDYPVPAEMTRNLGVQSFIAMALSPKIELNWAIELQQCSYARHWTAEEERLLQEIGRRLTDALSSLLAYRNLRESESRYHTLYNVMDEGVAINEIVRDENAEVIDYRVLAVNPAFTRHSVFRPEQIVGQLATQIYHMKPEFISNWWKQHTEMNSVVRTEMHYEPTDRWFQIITTPPDGDRFATFSLDISEHKRMEKSLHERVTHSQSLLRLSKGLEIAQTYNDILNVASNEVKTVLTYQNLWVYIFDENREYAKLFLTRGYISDVLMVDDNIVNLRMTGDPMLEEIAAAKAIVVVEDARTDPRTNKEIVAKLGNRSIINVPMITFENHLGTMGTGTYGDEGVRVPTPSEEEYLIAVASQLAVAFHRLHLQLERKQAEESLRESETRYRSIVSTMSEGVILQDRDGTVLTWNSAALAILGLSSEEFQGHSSSDSGWRIIREDGSALPEEEQPPMMSLRSGKAYRKITMGIQKADGSLYWILINSEPLFRPDESQPYAVLSTFTDITENRRVQSIMQARLRLLEFAISHTLDELLTATLDEIEALTGSNIGFYHFLEEDQETLVLQNWSSNTLKNMCTAEGKGSHYPVSQAGVWVEAVTERRAVIHNDYASMPQRKGTPDGHAPVIREVVVPVFRSNLIRAIIGVGNKAKPYTEGDIEIVSQLGDLSWDIAERKRAEETLQQQYSTLHSIINNAHALIFSVDQQYRYTSFNQGHAKTMKALYDVEIEVGHNMLDYMNKAEDRETAKFNLDQAMKGRRLIVESYSGDEVHSRRYFQVAHSPIKSETEEVIGVVVLAQDLTERAKAEEALKRYNQRLATLHDIDRHILMAASSKTLGDAVLSRLLKLIPCQWVGIIIYHSDESPELLAWQQVPELKLQIQENSDLLSDEILQALKAAESRIIPDLCVSDTQNSALLNDLCTQQMTSAMINPMIVQGQLVGALVLAAQLGAAFTSEYQQIAEEIADQVAIALHQASLYEQIARHNAELEQRVRERTAQLESANRELELFSYSVSHDLRTPLRAIQGFAEIINRRHRESLNDEGRRYFDYIVTAGEQMNQLIADLLDYARLGRQGVRLAPVNIESLLQELLESMVVQIEKNGAQIHLDENLPQVFGDKTLLKQIFANLLENAMIYHRPDTAPLIELGYSIENESVIFVVADNGIGIPAEYYEKVFQIFQRLHSTEEFPGTGIGLAIVRRSVELLNGRVWIESKLNVGTKFYIKLPRFISKEA